MGGGTSRRPLDRCGRRFDGASRTHTVRRWVIVGALRRPWASHRPCRQCRAQRTDIRVRLPMVPAPPGNGVVSHFQRPVHCRCTVAAGLRTHDRAIRMAIDDGGLRDCCRWDHHSPGSRLSQGLATEPPARFPLPDATLKDNARPALSPNVFFLSLLIASFLCCIPMAMPSAHLIAFCGDLGMLPVRGALALSMLLVCAFISRQFWGWVSDRYGGLPTLVVCSAVQAAATAGFVFTQSEAELFAVAAVFGLGFSGLIPAYILTVRELFPAEQAYWRVPMVFFFGMSGMAMGSWGAGLIYDYTGSYAPAFATGLIANLVNLAILLRLFTWRRRTHARPALA